MQSLDDLALLREYAANNSEAAFAELVARRIGFVYAAALRQVREAHLAEEVTQAVFIILAQKAGKISDKTILAGWLFKTTRYTAIAQTREIVKRQRRELEAHMQNELSAAAPDPLWEQMSPLLDEALATLGETDRQAVLLRFFENKSLAEVGSALGTGEDTARKRVSRALEKLHRYFNKRGVSSTTAILAVVLTANSVQAAPVALANSVTAVALAKGAAASGSTLTLIKGALKIMAWTKAKTVIVTGATILLVGGGTVLITEKAVKTFQEDSFEKIFASLPYASESSLLETVKPTLILRATHYPNGDGGYGTENGKYVFVNEEITALLSQAYGFGLQRMVLPQDLPAGKYDYLVSLPDHQNEALREELNKQFGLTARREQRVTDVLQLKVRDAAKLAVHRSNNARGEYSGTGDGHTQKRTFKGHTLSGITGNLEWIFDKPLVDRTQMPGRFDFVFQWQDVNGPIELRMENIRRSLRQQLQDAGLELVPAREPIEMLIVEREK